LRLYRRADRDKDGELDAREFARTFDVEAANPFLERLVRLFDVSGDGKLSPFEFVVCLSQFTNSSNVNRDAHVYFAWRLFDTNDDGSMSKPEFTEALRATYFRVSETETGKNLRAAWSATAACAAGAGSPTSAGPEVWPRDSTRSCATLTGIRTGASLCASFRG
jgi:Ca2+-binding EF-hand superfamily protein